MEPFNEFSSIIAPLLQDNIDTDAIIPASYMRSLSTDPGTGLFGRWRYRADGSEEPAFILNQPAFRRAGILLGGANFGCGSSRENAVWALQNFGIRCVIALSFSDIFYENCFKNGVLPIVLSMPDHSRLAQLTRSAADGLAITIALAQQRIIVPAGAPILFDIAGRKLRILLEGIDDITETLGSADQIARFRQRHRQEMPWLYLAG
jgi:3-isopropylmalate/(R)-2-methylmalate dehydratase small subunit